MVVWRSLQARALREALGVDGRALALIGDRRLTDVLLAREAGFTAVLVPPVDPLAEPFVVRVARRFENYWAQDNVSFHSNSQSDENRNR